LPIFSLILIATSLIFLFLCLLKYRRLLLSFALVSALMAFVPVLFPENNLEITIIPVGQGDSSLFSLPSGENILVDAGGIPYGDFDVGKHIVIPTLKKKLVDKIDILVITHPDPDHILGAFALLESMVITEIWHSGFKKDHPLTEQLIELAKEKNILMKETFEIFGSHRFGNTEVQVLAPETHDRENYFQELSANDNSVVLRIIHGSTTFLWPGDIENFGEQLLLSSNSDLHATILKAPHHGSRTSSSSNLIKAVNPLHVIYSTGPDNRFSFPHPDVVNRFRELGIQEWNTAYDGEITIKVTSDSVSICAYKNRICQNT
jgi:competence protein ComEC